MVGNMTEQQQQQSAFYATPAEMNVVATQQQQQPALGPEPGFFTSPAEMEAVARTRPEELISGFVPSGGVMVLAGAPGTGKSFVALSWAAAIAEGSQWLGHKVRQAPVVYVLGEGWGRFGDRIAAWAEVNGRPMSDAVHFVNGVPLGIDLIDRDVVDRLIEQLRWINPGLVIFDTFSMLARVSNENDNAEVAAVMANVNSIVQATGATVMLIHHVTKSTRSVRGASAFVGNADTVVMAEEEVKNREPCGTFMLSTDVAHGGKQRDGVPKTMGGFSIASPGVLSRASGSGQAQIPAQIPAQRSDIEAAKEKAMAAVAAKEQQNNDNKEQ